MAVLGLVTTATTVVHDPATPEEIDKAIAPIRTERDDLRNKLSAALLEIDTIRRERDAAKQQMASIQTQLDRTVKDAEQRPDLTKDTALPRDKIAIDLSVLQLMNVYKDKTAVQGDAAAALYIGKWITYRGTIADVSQSNDNKSLVLSKFSEGLNMALHIVAFAHAPSSLSD